MLFPPIEPPTPTFIDGLGNIALLAAGVTLLAFMLAYGFLANWRKYLAGRAIMYFVTGLVALLAHYIVSRFFGGDYFLRDVVRLAVYSYLFLVTLRLLVTFLVIWHHGNKEGDEERVEGVVPLWRRRKVEWADLRREHRAERRALRERLRRSKWDSSDDEAAHEAAAAHQEAEDRSSSSPTSG